MRRQTADSASARQGASTSHRRSGVKLKSAEEFVDAHLAARLRVNFLHDHRAIQAVFAIGRRQVARYHHRASRDAAVGHFRRFRGRKSWSTGRCKRPRDRRTFFNDHAFHHFRTRADGQLSSMMVGLACSGSSTPPMPTPPDRCVLPICAQEPTVAQVSTMVPSSSTNAPMLT